MQPLSPHRLIALALLFLLIASLWNPAEQPRVIEAAVIPATTLGLAEPSAAPRVAYIYNSDLASRDSFSALLSSRGFVVDLIPLSAVATTDFSRDQTIIIGDDTGKNSWGTTEAVGRINSSGKPIIGVGEGGASFFGALDLFIDYGQSWYSTGNGAFAVDRLHPIWSAPNTISVPRDGTVQLYNSATELLAVYNPTDVAGVTRIGRQTNDETHYPLIAQSVQQRCFMLWGFRASPATMTPAGKDLFINAILSRPCGTPRCAPVSTPQSIPSAALINFDNLSNSTPIGTSYKDTYGVTFESNSTTRALIYGNEPAEATSSPNVAINDALTPNTSSGVPMKIFFDTPKTHVGFWIGNGETQQISALLTAYDVTGSIICQLRSGIVPEPHTTFMGINDPAGRIASIVLDYGQTLLSESIDDLYFAPGPKPSPIPLVQMMPYKPVIIAKLPPLLNPDLSIHGIEITQGIQCFNTSQGLANCPDNSLPVVTKKDSTARIYLKYSGILSEMSNIPVRLIIRANGVEYTANASGKAKPTLSQANADDSTDVYFNVNFSNDVSVDFYAIVDPNNTITETNEGNNRYPASGYITMNFRKRDGLKIVGQRLRYHPSGYSGTQYAGGWAVNGGAADWYEQMLPIRNNGINYSVKSGYLDWTTSLGSGDGQHALIQKLNSMWIMENVFAWLFGSGSFTNADHVYGWAPNDGYSGGHADMPVYPHAGGLGVVGIGTDAPGTNTDNPGAGALIFGHEITHDYNIYHTDTGGDDCGSNDGNSDFPYATSSIQEFGFNPLTGKIYNPSNTHDLMSYCPAGGSRQGWISPFTWNKMFNNLSPSATNMLLAGDRAAVGIMQTTQSAESLVVNATIDNPAMVGKQSGQLGQLYRVGSGLSYSLPKGPYAVQLRAGDQILHTETFSVSFKSEYSTHGGGHGDGPGDPSPLSKAGVSFVIPWVDGATSVVLLYNGNALDQRTVSAGAPSVTITSPSGAATWAAGSTQTITWNGSDPDGNSLSYAVFYSSDGTSWELLATELTQTSFAVEVDALAGSDNTRFRVVASDGVNTGYDETDGAIKVPNKRPTLIISNPENRIVVEPGSLLVLQGTASDLEDGRIPDTELHWSSDQQGDLGVGPSLPVNTLQPGLHTITLTVTDSNGQSASASVEVFVGHRVSLPHVTR